MGESKFQWRETAPGQWVRDYDPIEKTLHWIAVASPLMVQYVVTVGATLTESVTIEKVKDAWLALRYDHPVLACTIPSTGSGLQYQAVNSEGLKEWVEATVKIDYSGKSAQKVGLAAAVPDASRGAELFFLPKRNEVFLALRHEICDGVGSLLLLNNLLKALRKDKPALSLEFGSEYTRLSAPITQISRSENPSADSIAQGHQMAEKYMNRRALSLTPKPLDLSGSPPQLKRIEHSFTEAETAKILKACKQRDITITHAATAVCAQTLLERSGETSGSFCTVCNINMRDLLPPPYNGPEGCVANLFTTIFPAIQVSKSSSLVSLSRHVKQVYNWWKFKKDNIECAAAMPKIIEDSYVGAFANGIIPPTLYVPISLGLVETYVKEPMKDFWFNLSLSGDVVCLYVYTTKKRLRFVYCYNSAFHDEESIRELGQITRRYLNKGLNITSETAGS
ncbi:hypothetical protein ABW20_dc0103759 [Dactylellina cionopaga]|nr:hypothetical protein ABW20_dc0103759 [Dactylellina cionopaga]